MNKPDHMPNPWVNPWSLPETTTVPFHRLQTAVLSTLCHEKMPRTRTWSHRPIPRAGFESWLEHQVLTDAANSVFSPADAPLVSERRRL